MTIASDGSTTFDVAVNAAAGATDFYGAVGVNHTFNFNVYDVINYIWDAIKNLFTGDYTLDDNDATGDVTVAYADDSSTDNDSELTTTDGSSDDTSDDSGDGGGCAVSMTEHADHSSSASVHIAAAIVPEGLEDDDAPIDCD